MIARLAPFAFLALAGAAYAVETTQWPPPEDDQARMRALQEAISKRDSTPEQREAARRELESLLRAPAAAQAQPPAARRPARAAIQPFPPIEGPVIKPPPVVDPSDVGRLEVVGPSRAIVNPRTGSTIAPIGSTVIDQRTGTVLQETPSGYLNPRTGQLIPK